MLFDGLGKWGSSSILLDSLLQIGKTASDKGPDDVQSSMYINIKETFFCTWQNY